MAHSAIAGFTSFAACSFFLGLGEAGNWPGAAKVIAEWFPQKERALGMAIFNGGASMGGVIAPLFVARYLAPRVGWRMSFLIVGALGFIWLVAWLAVYRPLARHPHVSEEERRYIQEGQALVTPLMPPSLRTLLSLRETWSILVARFLVDPVWWLYILWLPTYLKEVRHFSLKDIGISAWVPYLAAAIGSLFGGWIAGRMMTRGVSVNAARKWTTGIAACLMTVGVLAARAEKRVCSTCVDFYRSIRLSNVDHQCPDTAQRFFLERCSRKRGRDGRDGRRHQQPYFQPLHCVAGFALWVWRCPDDRGHARSRWSSRVVLACWKNSTFGYRRIPNSTT